MSNRQFQMSREAQGSTSARMPYDFYDSFLDESNNPNKEGLNLIFYVFSGMLKNVLLHYKNNLKSILTSYLMN